MSKSKEKNSSRGVTEKNNAFTGMPKKGTILATVSSDELTQYHKVSEDVLVLEANPRVFDKQETYDITIAHKQWWMDVCTAHNINYAWPITINYITGDLFISK